MKFGVEFVPYKPIDILSKLAKEVEKAGFEHIWICDHYHNRYVHSVLARLATETKRVKLGPGVTNPYLTHPAITVAAITTLDELCNSRAVLGISAGDPIYLATLGVRPNYPVESVGEAVHMIKELLAGKRVTFSGKVFSCKGAKLRHPPTRKIPIYIGGRRQHMLELAGSVADGVLINASHPDDLKECIAYVCQGAVKSNRKLRDLDITAYMATSIGEDSEKTRSMVKTVVAFITSSAPKQSLEHHGIPLEDVKKVRMYLRAGEIQKATAAVTPNMIEAFSVCGPLAKLKARVDDLRKFGITQIVIGSPIGPEPTKVVESIKKLL
jgi:5,10-methylenetetrahydromethanopterin reductase